MAERPGTVVLKRGLPRIMTLSFSACQDIGESAHGPSLVNEAGTGRRGEVSIRRHYAMEIRCSRSAADAVVYHQRNFRDYALRRRRPCSVLRYDAQRWRMCKCGRRFASPDASGVRYTPASDPAHDSVAVVNVTCG